jgi:hypothetical protein
VCQWDPSSFSWLLIPSSASRFLEIISWASPYPWAAPPSNMVPSGPQEISRHSLPQQTCGT